jgi:hypothetical protein
MRSKRLVPALAAGALLLAACGSSSDSSSANTAPAIETVATPETEPAAPVDAATDAVPADVDAIAVPGALQFSAPLVGGGELDASSLAGKPTVFWFWAPT